ncbi:MAG: flagellar biosynthesis protein FlhB [Lachnospiraceae bacterium]|nr:flagellar biosynthesis protein FlhB [Lachnospiraceae bacterium]
MKRAEKDRHYLVYDLQLFAKDGPSGEKTEEPTAKKLEDARKKGQTMKSIDVTTAAVLLTFFALLKVMIGFFGNRFMGNFQSTLGKLADYSQEEFNLNRACSILSDTIGYIIITALPLFFAAFVVTVISIIIQVKWKVTGEPLKPKLDRFNPVNGVKNLFSKDKLMDLFKSTAKVLVLAYVVYDYLRDQWAMVLNMYSYTLPQAIELIRTTVLDIGLRISLFFAAIAAVDFFYQKWKFHNDMMMSKQEVKDEYKQSEGDPKVKSQQRARMQQASQRRMMQELPKADVVITNPTHLAVAILYDKEKHQAPVVIAKGADFLAQKIKDVARENTIEIVENKPLARMLYHNVEIGSEIPPELYQMVAEVLAYVYGLKGKLDR